MLGWASTKAVTRALKASRSTARAPPAATRTASAAGSRLEPIRRISSFSRPEAESSRSALRLLEQISSAKPALLWAGEKWTGFCSYRVTCTPCPASQRAASHPARPAPMILMCNVVSSFRFNLRGAQPLGTGISKPQPSRAQYSLDPWRNRVVPHFSHLVGTGTSQVIKSQSG